MKARKTSTSSSKTSAKTRKSAKAAPAARTRASRATKTTKTKPPETPPETAAPPEATSKPAARTTKSPVATKQAESAGAAPKRQWAVKPATVPAPAPADVGPTPKAKRTRSRRTTAASTGEAAARKSPARKPRAPRIPKLPPILFETDEPVPPPVSGPGEKFALGPTPPEPRLETPEPELPEAYGTKRLHLTACDPHRLYAWWDLTADQQARYNRLSADGHLVLRIYPGAPSGPPALEIHLHPESRHWFARVERADAPYTAELGYYRRAAGAARRWTRVAVSATTVTPPETISTEATPEFATIPPEIPFAEIRAMAGPAGREPRPLARVAEELRRAGHPRFQPSPPPSAPLTPEQARVLEELISPAAMPWTTGGSLEITEAVRARALERGPAEAAGEKPAEVPTSPAGAPWNVSSPTGGEAAQAPGFWLNVNAELIVYGATDPGASVSVGDRPVALRPDGTFSCRFALPDGQYELPVVAVSPDRTETRAATLRFSRATGAHGQVGAQPGDPNLKPPGSQNA